MKSPQRGEHLKPFRWKKGQTGNPEGRPTGSISVVESLKAYLRRHPDELEQIVISLVKEGRLGNMVATKEIIDRVDGRVVETHKITGNLPVILQFVPASEILKQQSQLEEEPPLQLVEGED